uniref:Uncharacterized protein n=1 Tax=Oryza sativa subsp. japonica TaxID=39947 RepID=Q8GVP4_ORYSJ|nr:hypothetical protein [Oryza sativa Japonica Group]
MEAIRKLASDGDKITLHDHFAIGMAKERTPENTTKPVRPEQRSTDQACGKEETLQS